jgi:hypothetical protein
VFFVIGVAVGGYTQKVPIEVKSVLENYVKDSTTSFGLLYAKKRGRISDSVRIKDLRLKAIEIYKIKHIFLSAYPDTVPFNEIIEPSGHWLILVMAHNKPLYELYLDNAKGKPIFVGVGSLPSDGGFVWHPILETHPESTEISSVLFSQSGWFPIGPREFFIYFKQKGPRKIYYLSPNPLNDPLKKLFTGSIKTLDDSKMLIEYWKKQGLNEVGQRGDELERSHIKEIKIGGDK